MTQVGASGATVGLPFARPLYALVKPAGARCNLACRYCYYLASDAASAGSGLMQPDLLALFTRQYLEVQTQREVLFTWHGGEPTLLPVSFFEQALALQHRYAGWHVCDNALQTNGTLLTDDYCRFLHDNHFLVGLSLDGPQEMHDAYRLSAGGKPSWARVMQAVELLERHGVEWNAMAVVTDLTVRQPLLFYDFFRRLGVRYLQFTPNAEFGLGNGLPGSIHAEEWGLFLCALFDAWYSRDVGQIFIQLFESTLANYVGQPCGLCSMSPTCGDSLVVEANGDVYSCDHFAYGPYLLGNLRSRGLLSMVESPQYAAFRRLKTQLAPKCQSCPWLRLCWGECPRTRQPHADGVSSLCAGYRRFFQHVEPALRQLASEFAPTPP